ncbi:hypothetical protein Ct61P_01569 [Colletotrichum tofieldiae]|nr:hypothetical protein Ct61P_01569 [Colletotrichum tofieldiae]
MPCFGPAVLHYTSSSYPIEAKKKGSRDDRTDVQLTSSQHSASTWVGLPDFKIETDSVWLEESLPEGKTRLVFKTKNTGTFTHDLPRVKASGRSFWFPGVIEFIVRDDDGLIETINEWYTFKFDGVTSVNDYINRPQPKLA